VTTSPSQGNGGVRYFSCRTAEERDKWVHRYVITFDVSGSSSLFQAQRTWSLKIIAPQTLTQTTGFATYLLLNICFSCEKSTLLQKAKPRATNFLLGRRRKKKNYFLLFQTIYRESAKSTHFSVFSQHLCKFCGKYLCFWASQWGPANNGGPVLSLAH
jgi:hypothetical protein